VALKPTYRMQQIGLLSSPLPWVRSIVDASHIVLISMRPRIVAADDNESRDAGCLRSAEQVQRPLSQRPIGFRMRRPCPCAGWAEQGNIEKLHKRCAQSCQQRAMSSGLLTSWTVKAGNCSSGIFTVTSACWKPDASDGTDSAANLG
jgi:hypothetical protein